MEQQPFYSSQNPEKYPEFNSKNPENLLPKSPESAESSRSKGFEELVKEALEKELRYERDPDLRNKASERADQILAEFQESRSKSPQSANDLPQAEIPELPKQSAAGQTSNNPQPTPPTTRRPIYPGLLTPPAWPISSWV